MKSKTLQARLARLMPAGVPRYVRCYDSGPGGFDRFTVVFTGRAAASGQSGERKQWPHVGLSGHGFSWDGPCDRPTSGHLGKRVPFSALPEGLRATVLADYRAIWRLNPSPPRHNP